MSEASTWPARLAFGDFLDLPPHRRAEVSAYLATAWEAQYRRPISTLSADLDTMSSHYKPSMTPRALRKVAEDLPRMPGRRPTIDEALLIGVDRHRAIVTPEGRAVLEFAQHPSSAAAGDSSVLLKVCATLIDFYGEPRRAWMRETVLGGDLRPVTLGYVVFLLFNNSVGLDRALRLPKDSVDEQRLAGAVIPVLNTFALAVGGNPVKGRELTRIRSNWVVTQAAVEMPGVVRNRDVASASSPEKMRVSYIDEHQEGAAIDHIARALVRRSNLDLDVLSAALHATREAFLATRPLLLSWQMSWETTAHTRSVCQRLEDAVAGLLSEATR